MKTCIWCKEEIKPQAKKCFHCGTFQPPHFYFLEIILFVIPIFAVIVSVFQAQSSLEGAAEAAEALRDIKKIEQGLSWSEINADEIVKKGFALSCDYKLKVVAENDEEKVFFPLNYAQSGTNKTDKHIRFLADDQQSITLRLKKTVTKYSFDLHNAAFKHISLFLYERCPEGGN